MHPLNPEPIESPKETFISKRNTTKESFNNKTIKNRRVGFSSQPEITEISSNENKEKLKNINELMSNSNISIHEHTSEEDDNVENFKYNFKEDYNKLMSVNNQHSNSDKLNSRDDNNKFMSSVINSKFSNYNDSYKANLSNLNSLNENQDYTSSSNMTFDNNELLSKLDYIIHLLEQQHNEKTNHITEELILYLFLGIFIIYVLDSFARASKYIR